MEAIDTSGALGMISSGQTAALALGAAVLVAVAAIWAIKLVRRGM